MPEIYGLPQALTGNEMVTIWQEQNGQLAKCTMQLSSLSSILLSSSLASSLPTQRPNSSGVFWNDGGVVSIS